MAADLVREGVPLVLSMQTRVTDRYASDLSRELYAELARRETPFVSQALAVARQRLEEVRLKAVARGPGPVDTQPEYATASLFGGETEVALVDYALDRVPLAKPPVHRVPGPVPQLGIGELVGRRRELRDLLRVLRDHEDSIDAIGKKAGVVLAGIGGVGKSSLAGRAMARLKEDGWSLAATTGRFSIGGIALALGAGLADQASPPLVALGVRLSNPQLDDQSRLTGILTLLQTERVLLVLDNFEDNLEVGGARYLDETTATWLSHFAERAQVGKLLFTCRYPLPGGEAWFAHQTLGPLTAAETRKLFWRLPGIHGLAPEDVKEVMHHIGGHPRMLEYLDGILRKGHARLPSVAERLRRAAKEAGFSPKFDVDGLDEAVRATVLLGARDILLDELVALADEQGDTQTLLQCAVSSLPIDAAGVAHALADTAPSPSAVRDARVRLERLVDLSLVTALGADAFWVHRWTAEALAARAEFAERREAFARAGRYRLSRKGAWGVAFDDIVEATRNFLDAEQFDEASSLTLQITQFLVRANQSVAAAGFAGEILRRLPATHANWAPLADTEANSLLALGFTQNAFDRYRSLLTALEEHVRREPDRADYQRDLAISLMRIGALSGSAEELSRALAILSSLAASGRLDPVDRPMLENLERAVRHE